MATHRHSSWQVRKSPFGSTDASPPSAISTPTGFNNKQSFAACARSDTQERHC